MESKAKHTAGIKDAPVGTMGLVSMIEKLEREKRCWNSHYEMLEMLKKAQKYIVEVSDTTNERKPTFDHNERRLDHDHADYELLDDVEQVIAKAERSAT